MRDWMEVNDVQKSRVFGVDQYSSTGLGSCREFNFLSGIPKFHNKASSIFKA
jgi:hypothetical protein